MISQEYLDSLLLERDEIAEYALESLEYLSCTLNSSKTIKYLSACDLPGIVCPSLIKYKRDKKLRKGRLISTLPQNNHYVSLHFNHKGEIISDLISSLYSIHIISHKAYEIFKTGGEGEIRKRIIEDDLVEMVCYVKNMDIADIKTGMNAEIKLEAYPYNKFGTVDSEVTYISPGSFSHEQLGNVYLVKLSLNNQNEDIRIFTGLSGTVEIKTGKRTVMEYFLEPITKGFGESMKEK